RETVRVGKEPAFERRRLAHERPDIGLLLSGERLPHARLGRELRQPLAKRAAFHEEHLLVEHLAAHHLADEVEGRERTIQAVRARLDARRADDPAQDPERGGVLEDAVGGELARDRLQPRAGTNREVVGGGGKRNRGEREVEQPRGGRGREEERSCQRLADGGPTKPGGTRAFRWCRRTRRSSRAPRRSSSAAPRSARSRGRTPDPG